MAKRKKRINPWGTSLRTFSSVSRDEPTSIPLADEKPADGEGDLESGHAGSMSSALDHEAQWQRSRLGP